MIKQKKIQLGADQIEIYLENTQQPKLLFLHGFNSSFASFVAMTQEATKPFDLVTFNFPGNGASTYSQKITIEYYLRVARQFVTYVKARFPITIIMGHSLGGVIAAQLASEQKPALLILLNSFNPYVRDTHLNTKKMPDLAQANQQLSSFELERYKLKYWSTKLKNSESLKSELQKAKSNYELIKSRFDWLYKMQLRNKQYLDDVLGTYFRALKIPIVGIYAENDFVCKPLSQIKLYHEIGADIFKINDCAHSPISEDPTQTLTLLNKIITTNRK